MSFISYQFILAFIPITYLLCLLLPKKAGVQNAVLLAASLYFYVAFGLRLLPYLLTAVLITFFGGLLGSKALQNDPKRGKTIIICALVINLLLMIVPKYLGFTANTLNSFTQRLLHRHLIPEIPNILLPVGLSFFIFQSSSYLIDVLRGQLEAEKNILTYALFVSFFPTITSGPIQKSKVFLPKLRTARPISFVNFQRALLTFLWGVFLKIVLADRLGFLVDTVFKDYEKYGLNVLLIGAIFYTLQIYTDFSGYSYMAIAVARLFGFELEANFKQPYFAVSLRDFWKKWHISLTTWLTQYLYIPLGGSRKGTLRKYFNILVVFLASGLWHGAGWNFVVWGLLHAVFQIAESVWEDNELSKKVHFMGSLKPFKTAVTFLLVTFAWIFFRAETLNHALGYIKRMFTNWDPWIFSDGTLKIIGFKTSDWNIAILALILLIIVSKKKEKGFNVSSLLRKYWLIRLAVAMFLFFACVIFGIYGPEYRASDFIYRGF